jgi:hypothetical protein
LFFISSDQRTSAYMQSTPPPGANAFYIIELFMICWKRLMRSFFSFSGAMCLLLSAATGQSLFIFNSRPSVYFGFRAAYRWQCVTILHWSSI